MERLEELREKAHALPLLPGVYLMLNQAGQVIYVGKAKKLKNRVSQYFQSAAAHSAKTRRMVSQVQDFDVIMAATEFEALVLECSLIKRHLPKYNILLKDDKGYPYIRVDRRESYPRFTIVGKMTNDGATYFGPYGSRHSTQKALDALRLALRLPGCSLQFPRDVGKSRPCLNFQMHNCDGWCRCAMTPEAYLQRVEQACLVLAGKYEQVTQALKQEMEQAAEELRFEHAAVLRDRYQAMDSLGRRQLVVAGAMADTDVIGFYQNEARACFTVLHYIQGNLVDKDFELLEPGQSSEDSVAALVKQYYLKRGVAPKTILLPCAMEDAQLFAQLLRQQYGKTVRLHVPQRGEQTQLIDLAQRNAREEAERATTAQERSNGTLKLLGELLGLAAPPKRMEAYDISNLGGSDIVASMTVFVDGKPLKGAYKRYKIQGLEKPDDYASMRQVLHRRFVRFVEQDAGFEARPDLLLIDGGVAHAAAVQEALGELQVRIPIYGMVKDNRHRTRALVTPEGQEIGIAAHPAVFALIGTIQEETHRFAITYQRSLRSSRMKRSALNQIPGIGEKRRQLLLKQFHSVAAIRQATVEELHAVVPLPVAEAVYAYFH